MTQDKDLLLKYLCMALPYRTAIRDDYGDITFLDYNDVHIQNYFEGIVEGVVRPYLRPMSSMTDEEFFEYNYIRYSKVKDRHNYKRIDVGKFHNVGIIPIDEYLDWLLKKHFDFMGLIPKNLAIEVTENNNPYK